MSPDLEDEQLIWRIWKETGTPLRELRHDWTYSDLIEANAVLDMYAAYDVALEGLSEIETKEGNRGSS